MSKSARANTALWLIVTAVFLYCVGTLPDAAHGAPLVKPPAEKSPAPKNHINPDGTAVIYIYPHDRVRSASEIIKVAPPRIPTRTIA